MSLSPRRLSSKANKPTSTNTADSGKIRLSANQRISNLILKFVFKNPLLALICVTVTTIRLSWNLDQLIGRTSAVKIVTNSSASLKINVPTEVLSKHGYLKHRQNPSAFSILSSHPGKSEHSVFYKTLTNVLQSRINLTFGMPPIKFK